MFSKHVGFNDANVNGRKLAADATNLTRDGNKILDDGNATAADVAVVTTGFDGILSGTDADVQTAMATIDQHSHTAAQTSVVNSSFTGILASDTDVQASLASIDTAIPAVIDNYYDASFPDDGLIQKQALTGLMSQGMSYNEMTELDLAGKASATITVSNFMADDLEIVVYGRSAESDTQDYVALRFNSDTGSNYDSNARFFSADDASGGLSNDGAGLAYAVVGAFPGATASSDYPGYVKLVVNKFKETTYFKSYVGKCQAYEDSTSTNAGIVSYDVGGFWKSTSAITSVTVYLISSSNFASGKIVCRGAGAMSGGSFDKETLRVDAYLSSAQTISNETETTVVFDSEAIDLDSAYSNTTGVWTCPRAGKYEVLSQFELDTTSGYGYVYKNGSTLVIENGSVISTGSVKVQLKKTLDLAYGDTVQVKAWRSGGSQINSGISKTFLQISEVIAGSAIGDLKLTQDTTVSLLTSMSAADKQALIDATPHNLNGYVLTFQFEDGTHTHTEAVRFLGFYGGETMYIQGNAGEADALHTDQAVYIDATGISAGISGIVITRCQTCVICRNFKIQIPDLSVAGISSNNITYLEILGCYIYGAGKTAANVAISCLFSNTATVRTTYVSNTYYGITCDRSLMYAYGNASTGTSPTYGLRSVNGGQLATNGVYPTGSFSNWNKSGGGEIDNNQLRASTTVTLTTAMTNTQKQELINNAPHDLNGFNLTFQFEDGTHTADMLEFDGFNGGGTMYIQGNPSEGSTLHTDQTVYLDATGMSTSEHAIYVTRCACFTYVRYLKIQIPDVVTTSGIFVNICAYAVATGCYVYGAGKTTQNIGYYGAASHMQVDNSYVSNVFYGIQCSNGQLYSSTNDDTGTAPNYAIRAVNSGVIGTNSTQPAATKSVWLKSGGGQIDEDKLQASTTITFTTSNTVAEKQEMIDQAPHCLNGFTLSFQYADGTHTQSDALLWDGFYGNGILQIQGNSGETNSLHTNQAVYINGTGLAGSEYGIYVQRCACYVLIRYFKIQISDNVSTIGINLNAVLYADVYGNYVYGAAKTNTNYGFWAGGGTVQFQNNYVNNVYYGLGGVRAKIYSNTNNGTGTNPTYGLRAAEDCSIGKNSTQPTGTTANESIATGGVIR
jgi:hypothetical protein